MNRQSITNLVVCLICFGLPIFGWVYFDHHIAEWIPTIEHRGLYGDQFGALNALFAGLASGGVVFTLFLTYQQLKLQHAEFEQTTKSLQSNQIALASQTKMLSEQIADSGPRIHRVVAAEELLDFAELKHKKVAEGLREAIHLIYPEEKQTLVEKALNESDRLWQAHVDGMLDFTLHASPAPSGSTSSLASAISIQARMLEVRAEQLAEWTEWIRVNYEQ